jgi:hypothetical protein
MPKASEMPNRTQVSAQTDKQIRNENKNATIYREFQSQNPTNSNCLGATFVISRAAHPQGALGYNKGRKCEGKMWAGYEWFWDVVKDVKKR